jgi:hypothetical protein
MACAGDPVPTIKNFWISRSSPKITGKAGIQFLDVEGMNF